MTPATDPLTPIARTRVRPTGEVPRCRACGARTLVWIDTCEWCLDMQMDDERPWRPCPEPVIQRAAGYLRATP